MPATYTAFLSEPLLDGDTGLGWVIVLRIKSSAQVDGGFFLVDPFCLGVHDAFFESGTEDEVRELVDRFREHAPLIEKPGPYGRKLIEEAVAYAKGFGLLPNRDYRKAAKVFGGLKPAEDLDGFTFGRNGHPCYIQPRSHDDAAARKVIAKLEYHCGPDGYDILGEDEDDEIIVPTDRLHVSESGIGEDATPSLTAEGRKAFLRWAEDYPDLAEDYDATYFPDPRTANSLAECFLNIALGFDREFGESRGEGDPITACRATLSIFRLSAMTDAELETALQEIADHQRTQDLPDIEAFREFLRAAANEPDLQTIFEELRNYYDHGTVEILEFEPVADLTDKDGRPRIILVYEVLPSN